MSRPEPGLTERFESAEELRSFLSSHPGIKDRIRRLNLFDTNTTDDDLSMLSDMPKLTSLNLSHNKITDGGLPSLPSQIEELHLGCNEEITDTGVRSLLRLTNLRQLKADCTKLGDEGLVLLGELSELKILTVDNTRITDDGLLGLAGFDSLQKLVLTWTKVQGPGLAALPRLARLSELKLEHLRKLEGHHLEPLQRCTALERIELMDTSVGDDGITHLLKLPRLRRLSLACTKISDDGLTLIAQMSGLVNLNVALSEAVTIAGLRRLTCLRKLRQLDITGLDVDDGQVLSLLMDLDPDCRIKNIKR